MEKEQREIRKDSLKLRRLWVQFGLTIEKFREKSVLDCGTAKKFVFGIAKHHKFLHPDVPLTPKQVLEWDEEPLRLTDWERISNGLK